MIVRIFNFNGPWSTNVSRGIRTSRDGPEGLLFEMSLRKQVEIA